jgi:hypothetical protein
MANKSKRLDKVRSTDHNGVETLISAVGEVIVTMVPLVRITECDPHLQTGCK